MNKLRTFLCLLSIALFAILVIGGIGLFFLPNFAPSKARSVYIDSNKDFFSLCRQLKDSAGCLNLQSFIQIARWMDYPENMKTGHYLVTPGMSNRHLLNNLQRGHQAPVRITIRNLRMKEDLAGLLDKQLMLDGNELLACLDDETYCRSLGFTPLTIPALFIPNTYELYWNISVEKLLQRMKREYDAFWTVERRNKAGQIGITPVETAIIASIVEEESARVEEYPVIAGLYINRLHRGILLQADPTVKYAVGNFALQRILSEHLRIDSPYNTYLYEGLPPGPLRIPTITALDAVLNYTKHNYLYMCASDDFSGRHNFAVTLADHNRNADRYRAELNRRGIH
jgi:UPF0755 protein